MGYVRNFTWTVLLLAIAGSNSMHAQAPTKPVAKIVDWSPVGGALTAVVATNVDKDNAAIGSVANAQAIVNAFLQPQGINTSAKGFGCIIHIAKWGVDPNNASKNIVAKSNWYAYNAGSTWIDSDLQSNKRVFGLSRVYLLTIHLGVPVATTNYTWNYSYSVKHRLPANVQNLVDAINLFNSASSKAPAALDLWALGAMEGNPPSEIDITASVVNTGVTFNFDSAQVKFDNEGLYHWDVSIGVPVTSYKQEQSLVDSSGQLVQSNVDTKNVLILANWFIKPVDVKATNFLFTPHVVGGVKLASQPLHTALVGIGWGPAITNFYIGSLILTSKDANHKNVQHYKLGFGINVPLRTLAAKLGLKSQIE